MSKRIALDLSDDLDTSTLLAEVIPGDGVLAERDQERQWDLVFSLFPPDPINDRLRACKTDHELGLVAKEERTRRRS